MSGFLSRTAVFGALCTGVALTTLVSVQANSPRPVQKAIDEIGAAFARQNFDEIKTFFAPDHLVVTTYTKGTNY